MADSIEIPSDKTADTAVVVPGTGEVTKNGNTSTVTVNSDKPVEQKPETPVVPDKFKKQDGSIDTDGLLKSYLELESQRGTKPPEVKPEVKPAEAPKGLSVDDLKGLGDEFAKSGKLSDETYKALADKGHSKEVVDNYIAGQQAIAEKYVSEIQASVGGKEALDGILEWAGTNLTDAEIDSANAALKSGNQAQAKLVLDGLKARRDAAVGTDPNLVNGEGSLGTDGVKPFKSNVEVTDAMSDPRYKKDPAYRKMVSDRLAVTNAFGR